MVFNEKQKKIIKINIIMNDLKKNLKCAYDNKLYQTWLKGDRKQKFISYVIDITKEKLFEQLVK